MAKGEPEPVSASERTEPFFNMAELPSPASITKLVKPTILDFGSSDSAHQGEARSLLVQQRCSTPGYRRPEQQKRHMFRSKSSKERKCNEEKWVFTKHEVASAFNAIVTNTPLASPEVTQALLAYAPGTSLDQLWGHFHDKNLEKKAEGRAGLSELPILNEIPWLNEVIDRGSLEYINVICQVGLSQNALNSAFSFALSKRSMDAMEILLGFGADATPCHDTIRERIKSNDLALVMLLLSAPNPMSAETWRYCVESEITSFIAVGKQPSLILLHCLRQRSDIICPPLFLKALESQNLHATAVILAHVASTDELHGVRELALELVARIANDELRYEGFKILGRSGLLMDTLVLRRELIGYVQCGQLQRIYLLIEAGVIVDAEPYNAAQLAISQMNLDILELFTNARFSLPISPLLKFVPTPVSELEMIQLVKILGPKGLAGESLDLHLVYAVRNQHIQLVETLVRHGASIMYQQAFAIHIALEVANLDILNILLEGESSSVILSAAIPTAMDLKARPVRLQAMKALLQKGVLAQELGPPLQFILQEYDEVDSKLLRLLVQHQAPVDDVGNKKNNAVFIATGRGNPSILRILCDAGPSDETLLGAVEVALDTMHTRTYALTLEIITILLQKAISSPLIHKLLLTAAMLDHQRHITRLLIRSGADANYADGTSYVLALETKNTQLLETLCVLCPPNYASVRHALFIAIDPRFYDVQALETLLSSTKSAALVLDTSWDSERVIGNPNSATIISCFLRHGLNVNIGDAALLCFAIDKKDMVLLDDILSASPSIASLKKAFRAAVNTQPRDIRLNTMRLLLDKAQSAEIGQSKALMQETNHAISGDLVGLELLLRHKATVNFKKGSAFRVAAAEGSLKVLDLLIASGPTPFTLRTACMAVAAASTASDEKEATFERLLTVPDGLSKNDFSELLADLVVKLPKLTQLPLLLVAHGARTDANTLNVAVSKSTRALFYALASGVQTPDEITSVFRHARKTQIPTDRRHWVYKYLLGRGIPRDEVSEALIDLMEAGITHDMSCLKLLLENGAAAFHRNGAAFELALIAHSGEATKILSQYLDDRTATLAFILARGRASVDPHIPKEAFSCVTNWSIDKASLCLALRENIEGSYPMPWLIEILLRRGADPNQHAARCFVAACQNGLEVEFRLLSRNADPPIVLNALIRHFKTEQQIVRWSAMCLNECSGSFSGYLDALLIQCMNKFPVTSVLLTFLYSTALVSCKRTDHSCVPWKPEECTALTWALFSESPKIGNKPILALLRGGDACLERGYLTYVTPTTRVSAAFGCLLDAARAPILETLLRLDERAVLSHHVPGTSLSDLATYPEKLENDQSLPNELSLSLASLYLGNLEAFHLLDGGAVPDDGTLHTAALLALPDFVEWLLYTHDANFEVEEFDNMIPLALACSSKPQPWCKIANQQADWKTRQKLTMKLLAPRTDSRWRSRGKMVVHFALENGREATEAMIQALNIPSDPKRDDNYLYVDKEGIEYSLDQYVERVMGIVSTEKRNLIMYLRTKGKLQTRYFKRIMPGKERQPVGYCGLPEEFAFRWERQPKVYDGYGEPEQRVAIAGDEYHWRRGGPERGVLIEGDEDHWIDEYDNDEDDLADVEGDADDWVDEEENDIY